MVDSLENVTSRRGLKTFCCILMFQTTAPLNGTISDTVRLINFMLLLEGVTRVGGFKEVLL